MLIGGPPPDTSLFLGHEKDIESNNQLQQIDQSGNVISLHGMVPSRKTIVRMCQCAGIALGVTALLMAGAEGIPQLVNWTFPGNDENAHFEGSGNNGNFAPSGRGRKDLGVKHQTLEPSFLDELTAKGSKPPAQDLSFKPLIRFG
jgi:hypothetical protein